MGRREGGAARPLRLRRANFARPAHCVDDAPRSPPWLSGLKPRRLADPWGCTESRANRAFPWCRGGSRARRVHDRFIATLKRAFNPSRQ